MRVAMCTVLNDTSIAYQVIYNYNLDYFLNVIKMPYYRLKVLAQIKGLNDGASQQAGKARQTRALGEQ